MKKTMIAGLLTIVPNLAFAHSAITCDSNSGFGEVKITVTSTTAMSDFFSVVNVIGDGTMRDVNVMAQAESQPTIADQVVLKLKTVLPGTTDIDPDGIEAILTVKTKTVFEQPLVLQADGLGNLQLTKVPAPMRRLSSNYVLSNCQGVL